MVPLERGVHVRSDEMGFGYIDSQMGSKFLVQWDSGEFCTLTREQIEDELEVIGQLPLSVTPLKSSEVFTIDFKGRKLLKKQLFLY